MKKTPNVVFDEPRATGWVRTELYGDRVKAGELIPQARVQLGRMRTMYGVNQRIGEGEPGGFYQATNTLDDGSVIQTITNNGQDMVRIWADRPPVDEPEQPGGELSVGEFIGVAGYYQDADFNNQPFRWHPDEGFTLIPLATGYYYGEATGISWDSKRVCGFMGGDEDEQGFLWVKPEPDKGIAGGTISIGANTQAADISGDGLTIVANGNFDGRVLAWTEALGLREMQHQSRGAAIAAASFDGSQATGYVSIYNGVGGTTRNGVIWNTADGTYTLLPLPGTSDAYQGKYLHTMDRNIVSNDGGSLQIHTDYYPAHYEGDTFVRAYTVTTDSTGATSTSNNNSTYNERLPNYPYSIIGTETSTSTIQDSVSTETRTIVYNQIEWHVPHNFEPADMSYDGNFVCGTINSQKLGSEAALWSADGGLQRLGFLSGDNNSYATGVADDGSTVVGFSMGDTIRWFVWTAPSYDADGVQTDPGGMKSTGEGAAAGVSQSGALGAGRNVPYENSEGRMAVLRTSPVEDPATGEMTGEETRLGEINNPDGTPGLPGPSSATAITYITWTEMEDGTVVFDPTLEGITIEVESESDIVVTKDPAP